MPTDQCPSVPPAVKKRVDYWWSMTDESPALKAAKFEKLQADTALFPDRNDFKDIARGKRDRRLKLRADDRRVNLPLCYNYVMQAVAMTVPDDHIVRWRPSKQVPAPDARQSMAEQPDPHAKQFAATMNVLMPSLLKEIGHQEKVELWVQAACQYPIAIMKVTWQDELTADPVSSDAQRQSDGQDSAERIRVLMERWTRNDIQADSDDMNELKSLMESQKSPTQPRRFRGLNLLDVKLEQFSIDPMVDKTINAYNAKWMAHDVQMTKREAASRFPYKMLEPDADGTLRWTGVHPDDLENCSTDSPETTQINGQKKSGINSTLGVDAFNGKSMNQGDEEEKVVLVREIWIRREEKVLTLIKGVDYPVAEWVPDKQPDTWYPFVFLSSNPQTDDFYGVSDVRLTRDIQDRINRKRSDEEQARWCSAPRRVINGAMLDKKSNQELEGIPPYSWKIINMGGASPKLSDHIYEVSAPFDPQNFDSVQDQQDFRQMGRIPQALSGAVGGDTSPKFAVEMDAAVQGANMSAEQRQRRVARALERLYGSCAQLAIINMSMDEVEKICGQYTEWPEYMNEMAAAQAISEMQKSAYQGVVGQIATAVNSGQMQPGDVPAAFEKAMSDAVKQQCMAKWGLPTPLDRDTLYRRLNIYVTTGISTKLDRKARLNSVLQLFQGLGECAQAATASQVPFNPQPLVRKIAEILDDDDDLGEMFVANASASVMALAQALKADPTSLTGDAAQILINLGSEAAQHMAEATGQPPPGAAPAGNDTASLADQITTASQELALPAAQKRAQALAQQIAADKGKSPQGAPSATPHPQASAA